LVLLSAIMSLRPRPAPSFASTLEIVDYRSGPVPRKLAHPGWTQNLVVASGLQSGERVLVVVDEPLLEQGSQLLAAVADAGAKAHLELWRGLAPVDQGIASDLLLFLAQEPQAHEAHERFMLLQSLTSRGGRAMFLGFVDPELLAGELSQPRPDLREPARRLLERLDGAREVRITGRAGTDLTLNVDGRPWITDSKVLGPGELANYPDGEVFVAPHRHGADGVLVADLTVPYTVDGLVDEPVTLRFERGRVTSIEGGRAAQMLRELVADAASGADVIAELGIGFNPTVAPRGHMMLDEKAAKTAHVAIGREPGGDSGDNEASIHVDCVFSEPHVWVDGERLELP
jgi:leucyl aminopeptidase (aminopeptidase T)